MDDTILNFNYPTDTPKIIKVIGVGGGGGNAVTHMYKEGIHDVTFVLCNTDNQALNRSDVPIKLLLGREITQGLGAGNKPERAMMAAEESLDDLRGMLNDGTKMVFITAGMGGGTGTGAAPVVAKLAKDMVARYGMCEKLGTVSYLDDGEVFIGRDYQNTKSYSEKVAGTIDEEVKALIDQAYDDCKAILEKDGDKLQQVVAYLMEHETMTGAQFADLMEGRELSEASATALTDGYGEEESE